MKREQHTTGAAGCLPDKEPGQHRWVAMVMYALPPSMATAIMTPGTRVVLDHENRVTIEVGCWDCSQPYDNAHLDPCRGEAREV